MDADARIARLESEIKALEARMPRHSIPPAMLIELEDLEEELSLLKDKVRRARAAGD